MARDDQVQFVAAQFLPLRQKAVDHRLEHPVHRQEFEKLRSSLKRLRDHIRQLRRCIFLFAVRDLFEVRIPSVVFTRKPGYQPSDIG